MNKLTAKPGDKHALLRSREWARRLAMQAVYQQQVAGLGLEELIVQFQEDESFIKADADYFVQLLRGGSQRSTEIAAKIKAITGYEFDLVDPVERAVILNAAYEILFVPEIDKAVAITEAVRLTKKFGTQEGYRFVNGVLDKLDA